MNVGTSNTCLMMLLIDYETFKARELSFSLITTSVCLWETSDRGTLTYALLVSLIAQNLVGGTKICIYYERNISYATILLGS